MTAAGLREDRIPAIVERVDLLELVRGYAGEHGRQRGARYTFHCPLPNHDDRHPSFDVSVAHASWTCWSEDRHGDAIDLVMAVEGVTKREAIERLAACVGLDQPVSAGPRTSRRPAERREPDWADQLDAWTAKCHAVLVSGRPDHVWAYLRQRGLTSDDVRRWRLGFGLATGPKALRALHGRLVIPCPDGAEARVIPGYEAHAKEGDRARYRRPADDPSRPWGINRLDPGRGPVVLVEGVLDAIALERAEVQAVALRGKEIKTEVAETIAAAGFEHAYLGLDHDVPADRARERIRALARAGVRARVVVGPDGGRDWGDLLTLDTEALHGEVTRAMATPMGLAS